MISTKLMIAEELAELPADGYQYELIRGEVKRMAPPGGEHGLVGFDLARPLGNHVANNNFGRVFAAYLAFGVRAVRVLEPRRQTVTIHEAGRQPRVLAVGYVLNGGDVVPSFRLPLANLFI